MPQIADNIVQIFLRNGSRPRFINEIVDEYNIMYNPVPPVNYNTIYGAISREWAQDKYVFIGTMIILPEFNLTLVIMG